MSTTTMMAPASEEELQKQLQEEEEEKEKQQEEKEKEKQKEKEKEKEKAKEKIPATIEAQREGAETYAGDAELCKKKSIELLEELHLPLGLLPLEEMEEVGYNRATGFVWLRQKKKREHTFKQINRLVSYGTEITAFVEDRRMKKMTGVKSKELLIWLTLSDMSVDASDPSKITFKTPAGLFRTFPVSAFHLPPQST